MDIIKSFSIAKQFLGIKFFSKLDISFEQDEAISGLRVVRNDNSVRIFYSELCELFRGLTLVKEKIYEENYDISLKSNFDTNGLMIDCSRNGVVTVENIKKLILMEALMGHNRLLLYTEDTYELKKYPYFGYLRGAYTKEELKEVVEYGNSFGVELVPCIQTLDHLERPFRWDAFNEVKEGSSTVFVGEEKTYEFIEEMIKTSRECFSSKNIHIGMDESFNMGLGKYLGKHGYSNRVELFCKHLAKVIEICNKYDFKPMIWSDMFFRLNDENQEYYSGNKLPQETIDLIPNGIELVYWDYYHDSEEIYNKMISSHLDTKHPVYFAGGSWRWGGFAPALHKSFEFSGCALKASIKNDLKNVFVTAWGDNGNECSFYTCALSLAEYSSYDYYGECTDSQMDSLLMAVIGETKERMLLMDLPNMPANKVLVPQYNPSKYFFYQDPLLGLFDAQVKNNFKQNYANHAKKLLEASKESPNLSLIYLNLSRLCDVLTLKVDLGIRLRNAYKADDKKALKQIAKVEIKEIIKRIDLFRSSLEKQWNAENKRFGFEVLDGRIGFLKERLASTTRIINNYLKGNTDRIEELEKDILPYNGYDYEISWNNWETTVSACGL